METTLNRPSLSDRLAEPETTEMLHRLLDHAQTLDQVLQVAGDIPNLLAIAVDFFDAVAKRVSDEGINLEERATGLLRLLRLVTDPQNQQAMESLVSSLPALAEGGKLAEELPNLMATAVDVFDEWATKLKAEGISLEESVRRGLHAALYLGGQIREHELDRIGFLLRSDVLSEQAVETVSLAGTALTSCRKGTCEQQVPPRMGILGALKVLRDPHAQRAVSFAMQFAKCFGNALEESHPTPNSSNKD
ncbi:MAG: DUF1641 domain-containing protein [Planctomycetaceae bacterium]